MLKRYPLIKTKFIPPSIKETNVHRPRLMKKMKRISDVPVTLIHSGPGYGKSTSISAYLAFKGESYCWYSLSKQEDNFIPFLVNMIYAVQTTYSSFGENLLEYILNESFDNIEEEVEFLCSEFINELTNIKDEFTIVLDDIHFIEPSKNSKKWLGILVEYIPKHVHLVLSGRIRPTWDQLTRLLVHGELLEITEADLSFSKEEIDVLFADFYQQELNNQQINYVYDLTEGWIIAIQMIWQQLKITGDIHIHPQINVDTNEELFRYLVMEVLANQSEEVQNFLLATSILDEFDVSICEHVFNIRESNRFIENLLRQNLFIIPLGSGQYRYHPLFKDFLIKQLHQNKTLYFNYHQIVADYYYKNGNFEQAIFHYQEIGENFRIGEILEKYGLILLQQGKIEAVSKMFDRLSMEVKNRYIKLWFIEGEINRYFCYYEKALSCYRQLEGLAEEQKDLLANSFAQEGKAKIYLDTIQPAKADGYLSQAIRLIKDNDDFDRKLELYSLMTENLVNLGKTIEAKQWLNKCREVNSSFRKVELESRYYLRTGKLHHAKKLLDDEMITDNENHLSQSHRDKDLILSIICSFMGELEKGKRLAERAIINGTMRRAPFVEGCGWTRMGHAVQLDSRYDTNLAINCYETALGLMGKINMSRGKSEAYMGLTVLYGRIGDFPTANKMAKMALEEPTRVKDHWLVSCIQLSLGVAAIHCRELEKAEQSLIMAYKGYLECGGNYGLTVTTFWLAKLAYDKKNKDEFKKHMEQFLINIQKFGYDFFLTKKTLFGPSDLQIVIPMLIDAREADIQKSFINILMKQHGYENLTFHPGYTIKVKTLGEFKVWIGNKKVSERDWKREKAKELFQLFITYQKKMFSKEDILSLLWKDLDVEVAQRDFKVAFNALNKVIEPERKARTNPFFIQREDSLYGINKEAFIEVDSIKFEITVEKGLKEIESKRALELLQHALQLYEGDYLPTRKFDDWCIEERDRLLALFLRGSERVAQIHIENGDFDSAIQCCENILLKDACWEEAYRILMYAYYEKQNRTYAIRIYERCVKQLMDELGVEPLESTKKMYEQIKENKLYSFEH